MAQRRLVYPQTMLQKTEQINRAHKTFSGMNADLPASEIGSDEMAEVINMTCHGRYMRTRPGSSLSLKDLPQIGTKTYTVKKIGTTVYVANGTGQAEDLDVGNFLYVPGATEAYQIGTLSDVTDGYGTWKTFTSYLTDNVDTDTTAYQIGCPYGWILNRQAGFIVLHSGPDLFIIKSDLSGSWIRIQEIGSAGIRLAESKSTFNNDGEDVIVYNSYHTLPRSSGIYLLDHPVSISKANPSL